MIIEFIDEDARENLFHSLLCVWRKWWRRWLELSLLFGSWVWISESSAQSIDPCLELLLPKSIHRLQVFLSVVLFWSTFSYLWLIVQAQVCHIIYKNLCNKSVIKILTNKFIAKSTAKKCLRSVVYVNNECL